MKRRTKEELRDLIHYFLQRCEIGEIKSKRTYQMFMNCSWEKPLQEWEKDEMERVEFLSRKHSAQKIDNVLGRFTQ